MIQPRWYQEECIDAIWHYFASGATGNPLIGLPTGTGKSLIPAIFIHRVMKAYPSQRFLLLTSVKELIAQNAEVLRYVWPDAPLGIFSAGLKLKNPASQIVYAGIQSAIKDPVKFGSRDLIWVDEAHLISPDETSMYQTFLGVMRILNPRVKVVGMSATLFRQGLGPLTGNNLFTDIIYDMTDINGFNRLLAEGFLSPIIPLRTREELSVEGVQINNGEFVASQLQAAVDKKDITYKALQEVLANCGQRRSWLAFASGIEHAEHIAEMLNSFGVKSFAVHSKKPMEQNDAAIKAFKNFELKCIVNYGKLTTGFNHPAIDLIIMLRPTLSVALWVQMLGRATRPYEDKKNALVFDFAKNTPRLGPINDVIMPRKKGEKPGEIPVKLCEQCGAYNHTRVQFCCQCGAEFQFKNKLVARAGTEELLKSDLPVVETFSVTYPTYKRHQREGKPPCIKVMYHCGMQAFPEFVFPEHEKMKWKFKKWWQARHNGPVPDTVDEVLKEAGGLKMPKKIRVWCNKTYKGKTSPEVLSCEWT